MQHKYRIILRGEYKNWAGCWCDESGQIEEYIFAVNDEYAVKQLRLLRVSRYPDYYAHGRLTRRYVVVEFVELRAIPFE